MLENEVIFTIPSDFKLQTLNQIISLNGRVDIKIREIYGSCKDSEYGSGRKNSILPNIKIENMKEYILYCQKNNIIFNYTLNMNCIDNSELTIKGKKQIINYVEKLVKIGINDFTVSIPSLVDIFEKYFPKVNITISVIEGIDSVSKLKYFCNYKNVKNIYIHEKLYRKINLLKNMSEIAHTYNKKIGIIVNSLCLSECPFRQSHYNFSSHANDNKKYIIPEYYSTKCGIEKIRDKRKVLTIPWIRPEDIELYKNVGIDRFKISGRELAARDGDIIKMVETYNNHFYNGNLMELFKGFSKCSYSEIFYIKNDEKINKYLNDVFEGKIDCYTYGCTDCMKCKEALESIQVNDSKRKEWETIYENRIKKLKNEIKE